MDSGGLEVEEARLTQVVCGQEPFLLYLVGVSQSAGRENEHKKQDTTLSTSLNAGDSQRASTRAGRSQLNQLKFSL